MQKKQELDEMTDRIKATFRRGQKCSNCHETNHTVRSCTGDKCESSFLCGDLSKHPDEKLAIQGKKRAIASLETAAKKISQELTARKAALLRVSNSVNTSIEDILLDEYPDNYTENGVRDWLKIQQDVAFVKKFFRSGTVPSRKTVKSAIDEKYEDKVLKVDSSRPAAKRHSSCSAIETKLASYGVQFPAKRGRQNTTTALDPRTVEEEQEQVRFATTLSMFNKGDENDFVNVDVDEAVESIPVMKEMYSVEDDESSSASEDEAASILLSLRNNMGDRA